MASINKASANNATDAAVGKYAYNDKPANWNNNIPANTPGKKNNAGITDVKTLIQAGIEPKTGLPIKAGGAGPVTGYKSEIKKLLRIIDEQDAIQSFNWYNLPEGLDGELIERILYYRGQGMFFYLDTDEKFYFLPYALDGTIDVYGRFTDVTPLPFNGAATSEDKDKPKPWITGLRKHCIYDVQDLEELSLDTFLDGCVLLHDYSCQQSQTNISRQILNDPIIDFESEMMPFMHTALLSGTGVQGMRVNSEDEQSNVKAASRSLNRAALTGEKFVPIVGLVDFQELTGGNLAKGEEFLMAMQSIDNIRLSTHGLQNGGIFQKKAHMLQDEQNMNAGKSNSALSNRTGRRQKFCDIVNSIWGLDIWCEPSEIAISADTTGDGLATDSESNAPQEQGGDSNDLE